MYQTHLTPPHMIAALYAHVRTWVITCTLAPSPGSPSHMQINWGKDHIVHTRACKSLRTIFNCILHIHVQVCIHIHVYMYAYTTSGWLCWILSMKNSPFSSSSRPCNIHPDSCLYRTPWHTQRILHVYYHKHKTALKQLQDVWDGSQKSISQCSTGKEAGMLAHTRIYVISCV